MVELLLIVASEVIATLKVNASEAFEIGRVAEMDGTCDTFTIRPCH